MSFIQSLDMGNLIAYFCEIFGGENFKKKQFPQSRLVWLFSTLRWNCFADFVSGSPANTSAGATGQQASSSYDIDLKMQI